MLWTSIIVATALAGTTIEVPADRPTLSSALSAAAPGDSIRLAAGTWGIATGQNLDVPILGVGPETILARGGGDAVVMATDHDVVLRNLTIDGEGRQAMICNDHSAILTDVVLTGGGPPTGDFAGGGLVGLDDCDASFERVTFESVVLASDGGQLHGTGSRVTIVNSTFAGGSAARGGAAFLQGGTFYLFDSEIAYADATEDGGGLYLEGVDAVVSGTTFSGNTAPSGAGGAWRQVGGAAAVSASTFLGNQAGSGAGALVADGDAELDVQLAVFTDNRSDDAGAASCGPEASCFVTDSTFVANTGGAGGALALHGPSQWQRNLLCDNTAAVPYGRSALAPNGSGGAVYLPDAGAVARQGEANIYVRNVAELGGGAIHSDAADAIVRHATMVGNIGSDPGSAVEGLTGALLLENSAVLDHATTAALHRDAAAFTTRHDLFWNNVVDATFPLDVTDLFVADPRLADVGAVGCAREPYVPQAGSPLIDAGSGDTDPDGSPPDIGATGGPIGGAVDLDGDGVPGDVDCDDLDPTKNVKALVYPDADGDTWGDPFASSVGCPGPDETNRPGDCDDGDASVNPGMPEILGNGVDDDCDGRIDEDNGQPWYEDGDGDGFGDPTTFTVATEAPPGTVADGTDCDDTRASVNPSADEVCDGLDNDCDTLVDDDDPDRIGGDTFWLDGDGDGFGDLLDPTVACAMSADTVDNADDCDDTDPDVRPDATEVCNTIDDDCDTLVDDDDPDVTGAEDHYVDADGDGFTGTLVVACEAPAGSTTTPTDCDDGRDDVNPEAAEICDDDNVDEDCDGLADDLDDDATGQQSYPLDEDGDGFGAEGGTTLSACDPPPGAAAEGGDCDDDDPRRNPGARDLPDDGIDQDCDGVDAAFSYRAGSCGCAATDAAGTDAGGSWAPLARRR